MKKILFTLLVAILVTSSSLFAGSFTSEGQVVHLQGDTSVGKTLWLESQVKLVFNHLKLAWDHNGKVDRIRYHISCKDGKVVLQNVEYVDEAVHGHEHMRWIQTDGNLERDFSFIKDNRDRYRDNVVKYSTRMNIAPADLDTAKVKFHFLAMNRHYIVVWEPKNNKFYTTWERI